MNLVELEALVKNGESDALEFKKSTAKLQSAFETLCGFLNCKGGTVLTGVTDAGVLVGQAVADATKREVAKHLSRIEPSVEPIRAPLKIKSRQLTGSFSRKMRCET